VPIIPVFLYQHEHVQPTDSVSDHHFTNNSGAGGLAETNHTMYQMLKALGIEKLNEKSKLGWPIIQKNNNSNNLFRDYFSMKTLIQTDTD
jgi:hypothetical protein